MTLKSITTILSVCSFSLVLMMSSCRSARHASSVDKTGGGTETVDSPKGQVMAMVDSYKDWTDVSMSVKCTLRSPKSLSVSGKAVMVRGEQIKISVRVFGFEVAGLLADRDSIYVYEKLNHTMIAEPMSRLTGATGLDLGGVQDILLGRIVAPQTTLRKASITADGNTIDLLLKNKAYEMIYTILGGSSPSLQSLSIDAPGKGDARCVYAPALVTDAGPVSPSADITAHLGKRTLDASMKWSLESAAWNKGVKADGQPPKGYSRISLQQLVKLLGSI